MKKSEVAEATAETLARYGWVKGEWGGVDQGFCLLGAAFEACIDTYTEDREWEWSLLPGLPFYFAASGIGDVRNAIALVNDVHLESEEEAIEVCMKAAKFWRDKGE